MGGTKQQFKNLCHYYLHRSNFFHGVVKYLVTTERFHFYHRYKLRGFVKVLLPFFSCVFVRKCYLLKLCVELNTWCSMAFPHTRCFMLNTWMLQRYCKPLKKNVRADCWCLLLCDFRVTRTTAVLHCTPNTTLWYANFQIVPFVGEKRRQPIFLLYRSLNASLGLGELHRCWVPRIPWDIFALPLPEFFFLEQEDRLPFDSSQVHMFCWWMEAIFIRLIAAWKQWWRGIC